MRRAGTQTLLRVEAGRTGWIERRNNCGRHKSPAQTLPGRAAPAAWRLVRQLGIGLDRALASRRGRDATPI